MKLSYLQCALCLFYVHIKCKTFVLLGPNVISGHTGAIKDVTFLADDTIASIAQDQTLRLWDRRTGTQCQQVTLQAVPNSMEISKDGSIVTISHGSSVSFLKISNG